MSHVVDNSWSPLFVSGAIFLLMNNCLIFFKLKTYSSMTSGLVLITVLLYLWFRDTTRESMLLGTHTNSVQSGLKWGLVWFLFSEVWFFFSVFWSFFHFSSSVVSMGHYEWPYFGIEMVPLFQIPLLNTIILLGSGLTVTVGHMDVLKSTQSYWFLVSAGLGIYFMLLQGLEYFSLTFSLSSSTFGNLFFFGTGFHGLHVTLGLTMLLISHLRVKSFKVSSTHHFSLEFSIWYWHFVDIVWLFLFFWVYFWGQG